MKLILIITDFGSFNNFLSELSIEFLKTPENELHVICDRSKIISLQDKYDFKLSNLNFHFIPFSRGINIIKTLFTSLRINRIVKSIKPDLIHAHFTTGVFPTILFRKSGIKYWGTFHGLGMNSSEGWKRIIFNIIEKTCFFRLDRIFVVNNQDFQLLKYLGYSNKTIKYDCLGFGCNVLEFDSTRFSLQFKKSLREELKIKNQIVITFTGRFVKFKGFDLVIRSFIKLDQKYPERYRLLLIGGEDSKHGSGLSTLEHKFLNSSSNIIRTGFTNEVAKYLCISDIFLFPSQKEGLPTCVMEALCMGIPVIVANSRGCNDLVTNDYNGNLIEKTPNQIDEIIKAVEKLSNDDKFYTSLRKNSIADKLLYSRSRFINLHIEMYDRIDDMK